MHAPPVRRWQRVARPRPADPRRNAAELAATGLALPGTLIERHVRCGKPRCACHADPPVLHGPYWQWTRKVAGKTITRLVSDEQLGHRDDGSATTASSAPSLPSWKPSPWPSQTPTHAPATPRGQNRPKPPNPAHKTVDERRLTCG